MQIPILSGVMTDEGPDFRTKHPRNMIPVPKQNGISAGYLRPGEGIVPFGTGPGPARGGIAWNGVAYRVMGSSLVRVDADGAVTELGVIAGSGQCSFDYSFDHLAIAGGGKLYYSTGGAPTAVTDPDLGPVLDVMFRDGYFVTTDGTSIVVTDLRDPTSVNPLHYGSSEADPDPIMCNLTARAGEFYAVNRFTIEMMENVGGNGFPFARVAGAQINRGAIGTHAATLFKVDGTDQIVFLGGGRTKNSVEPPAVWVGVNGSSQKVSTSEIDKILRTYSEAQLAGAVLETRLSDAHALAYVHLPDQTLVYDAAASAVVQEPVWFTLDSGLVEPATYRARDILWCYDRWLCADPTSGALGQLDEKVSTHYDQVIGWEFGTGIVYNEGFGAIFHELELVTLPGHVPLGADPVVWTSYSVDGETWSQERSVRAGRQGQRGKRLVWLGQGTMEQWRIQRFRGTSDAHLAVARLEAKLEPLNA